MKEKIDKQAVEEMARVIEQKCNRDCIPSCDECIAQTLYKAGYRKQSEWISSAADVVPKSKYDLAVAEREANVKGFTEELTKVKTEVAREIFEEIEKLVALKMPAIITPIFKRDLDYSYGVVDGKRGALFEVLALLAELKKKYVPDTNDGNIVKDPEHRCIYCQEIIPQGRDICGMCEIGMDALNKYNKNNNQGG